MNTVGGGEGREECFQAKGTEGGSMWGPERAHRIWEELKEAHNSQRRTGGREAGRGSPTSPHGDLLPSEARGCGHPLVCTASHGCSAGLLRGESSFHPLPLCPDTPRTPADDHRGPRCTRPFGRRAPGGSSGLRFLGAPAPPGSQPHPVLNLHSFTSTVLSPGVASVSARLHRSGSLSR